MDNMKNKIALEFRYGVYTIHKLDIFILSTTDYAAI